MSMSKNSDFDAYAGIHYRDLVNSDPNNYGGPLVMRELGSLGIGVLLIPNREPRRKSRSTQITSKLNGCAR